MGSFNPVGSKGDRNQWQITAIQWHTTLRFPTSKLHQFQSLAQLQASFQAEFFQVALQFRKCISRHLKNLRILWSNPLARSRPQNLCISQHLHQALQDHLRGKESLGIKHVAAPWTATAIVLGNELK